jgi:hypothetical protein
VVSIITAVLRQFVRIFVERLARKSFFPRMLGLVSNSFWVQYSSLVLGPFCKTNAVKIFEYLNAKVATDARVIAKLNY